MASSTVQALFPEVSGLKAMRNLAQDPSRKGCIMLGQDGIFRSFDGSRKVIDAIALSPRQIKEILDQTADWSQEIEDQFRGVDGRKVKVTDRKAIFEPEEDLEPKLFMEEDKAEMEKKNEEMRERIEQEKRDGVDVAAKYACGRQRGNFNLNVKEDN